MLGAFDSVSVIEGVDVDPLESSEWGEELAVVESTGSTDGVVSGSSHHGSLDGGFCLIFVVVVGQVSPDPERASIIWTFIVSNDNLLAY